MSQKLRVKLPETTKVRRTLFDTVCRAPFLVAIHIQLDIASISPPESIQMPPLGQGPKRLFGVH